MIIHTDGCHRESVELLGSTSQTVSIGSEIIDEMGCSRHLGRVHAELLDDDRTQSLPHICFVGGLATLTQRSNDVRVHLAEHRKLRRERIRKLDAELVLDGHDQLDGAQTHGMLSVEPSE